MGTSTSVRTHAVCVNSSRSTQHSTTRTSLLPRDPGLCRRSWGLGLLGRQQGRPNVTKRVHHYESSF